MKVLIIDDNQVQSEELATLLDSFFKKYSFKYEVTIHSDLAYLLENAFTYDLIFLDIEVNGKNGIDAAINLRRLNKDVKLIFVSNFHQYLEAGYKAHADRYFLKPLNKLEFYLEMEDVLKSYFISDKFIFDRNVSYEKIYVHDILYIEVLQRKTILHLLNKRPLSSTHTLLWWETELEDAYFTKIHKSYLVNIQNIDSYKNNEILLVNNKSLCISRTYKNQFQLDMLIFSNSMIV